MRRASEATLQSYEEGASQFLAAARFWIAAGPIDLSPRDHLGALVKMMCADRTVLALGTVCVYRQHLSAAVDRLVRQGLSEMEADAARARIFEALGERQGVPNPKRGASLKIEVPEFSELAETFALLKKRFFEQRQVQDLLLCLYLLVMPRVGLRPVELTWAKRTGRALIVATAKREGRPERIIPLTDWPDEYMFALDVLLRLVPREMDPHSFKLWRNSLASRLARVSRQTHWKRRLALYCCRHIAFASWRDVGMSVEDIRRLAGHAGINSQRNYARGRRGYGARWMFMLRHGPEGGVDPASDEVSQDTGHAGKDEPSTHACTDPIPEQPEAKAAHPDAGHAISAFEFDPDDFPMPPALPPANAGADQWTQYRQRLEGFDSPAIPVASGHGERSRKPT